MHRPSRCLILHCNHPPRNPLLQHLLLPQQDPFHHHHHHCQFLQLETLRFQVYFLLLLLPRSNQLFHRLLAYLLQKYQATFCSMFIAFKSP
jgi:hypothetical protein